MSRRIEILNLKNICNVYLWVWVIPQLYKIIVGASSVVSLAFSLPLLLMTVYYFAQVIVRKRKLPFSLKILLFFYFFLFTYGLLDLIGNSHYTFLMAITNSILPIFVFYEFFCRGLVTEKMLRQWFWVFIVLVTLTYFNHRAMVLNIMTKDIDASQVVNNISYLLIGLFPFVFLFKKSYLQIGIIIYLSYFTLVGLKRGAILILALLILWYMYSRTFVNKNSKLKSLLFVGILGAFLYYFIINQMTTNDALIHRMEMTMEGDTSGRDVITDLYWDHYLNKTPVFNQIFGSGAWATEQIANLKAHNEWLEIIIDFGIVGCIIYLLFWLSYWKDLRRLKRDGIGYTIGIACIILSLGRTPFSMWFYVIDLYIGIMIAYSLHEYNGSSVKKYRID